MTNCMMLKTIKINRILKKLKYYSDKTYLLKFKVKNYLSQHLLLHFIMTRVLIIAALKFKFVNLYSFRKKFKLPYAMACF